MHLLLLSFKLSSSHKSEEKFPYIVLFPSSLLLNNMEEIFVENPIEPQIDDLSELTVFAFNTQVLSLQYLCAVLHNCNYKGIFLLLSSSVGFFFFFWYVFIVEISITKESEILR